VSSANLPFTVLYRGAAKSEQGMQHKFSALRSLAASPRALLTHTCMYIKKYMCVYTYIYQREGDIDRFWCRERKGNFTPPKATEEEPAGVCSPTSGLFMHWEIQKNQTPNLIFNPC